MRRDYPVGVTAGPSGLALGPFVEASVAREFDQHPSDGTFVISAAPGTYLVALQTTVGELTYQGYSSREFGQQWFVEVKAGQVVELPFAITLAPKQRRSPGGAKRPGWWRARPLVSTRAYTYIRTAENICLI